MHPTHHAARLPDKPALIMAGTGETVTYSQLDARSNQGAHLFRTLGLTTGDGIAIFSENNARFLDICWAAQRAGLYFTCISSRLTAGEIAYIVKDCGAKALIASHTLAKAAGETAPLIEDVKLFMLGGTIPGFESYEVACAAMPETPIADETSGTDMLYSSGTTGRPKGIRSPLSGMPIDTPSPLLPLVMMLFGMNEETVYLSTAPLYHAAPLRYSMSVQRLGGTVVVMEHFDPEETLRYIEKYKGHRGPIRAHDVRAHVENAGRDAREIRCLHAQMRDPCGGAVPRRCETSHDRMVGAGAARILCRDRRQRILPCR